MNEQPTIFPGYVVLEMRCACCGHEWVGVAAVGTEGVQCPKCDMYDPGFAWLGPEPWMPHDGAWLKGEWRLPWWPAGGPACPPAGTGAVKRWLQRLRALWGGLRGV